MEVVSTFKRSGSFQGAMRRRSSVLSQLHDCSTGGSLKTRKQHSESLKTGDSVNRDQEVLVET
ncbi:Plasma membrane calcium-transporting ATPase 3 [Liparis tanakae]|uniref:Plasma membrane calcium-transporting ATPase 3 n=1 Tax=Liparis tanakae TaxID=230148 RepID=A0A4Z2JEH1_9TELE|nr:Plasma membrane calcium-transporting ATPase 3 [Liparis tanakae]